MVIFLLHSFFLNYYPLLIFFINDEVIEKPTNKRKKPHGNKGAHDEL
ncbi:MAG: hypothetical protein A4E25_00932 [Methanobacterium sp. PtaB.Bin024]|jgi:hypothetical protein|nr:MAG: hypothetical protein A4E25_00932 [Methanobacterium sp. PtaB.Bin024]